MTILKVLGIKENVMSWAANVAHEYSLSHEIEKMVANVKYARKSTYGKSEVVQLITSIEREKIRFLRGHTTLKYLYIKIESELDRFKMHHPGFDHLNTILNTYYS